MRVLVIGGAGFIGSHICELLLDEPDVERAVVLDNLARGKAANLPDGVELVEGSILDLELVDRLVAESTDVFHLAALWLHECVNEPRAALEHNITGTFNVAEACVRHSVRKLVYSSSASVYGDALYTPMDEGHPFNNRTMYGATKIAGEQILRALNEQHGLDWVGLRYMNVYGPRMDDRGAYVSVVVKVLDRIDRRERPQVFGDGSQAYDFIHVRDVARANLCALRSSASDAAYNVGTGVETTIRELVDELLTITGSEIEPEYLPKATTFVTHRVGSTEAAERDLGFRAEIPWRDGLRTVVDWRRAAASR